MKRNHLDSLLNICLKGLELLMRAITIIIAHLVILFTGIVIGAILCPETHAKKIYYGSETETVRVAYGGPTLFRFNKEVKTISRVSRFVIAPSNKANPDYTLISIRPRFKKGSDKVTFLLVNGAVITVKMIVVSKKALEGGHTFYDFIPKDSFTQKDDRQGPGMSDLELIKAMIRWEEVVGYKARSLVRFVDTGNRQLVAKLVRIYSGAKYNGYVFRLQNLSKEKSYAIDLNHLSLGSPNQALLSQVDRKVLAPKGSGKNTTLLRIVAKSTSLYKNVNLPLTPIKKKGESK